MAHYHLYVLRWGGRGWQCADPCAFPFGRVRAAPAISDPSRETEKGRNGDSAWPLWGIAMRLLQAVSFHMH